MVVLLVVVSRHGWGPWSQGRHQKVGTWAPKANPRAMEEEREGVAWAPKANPRQHQMGGTWAPKANPRAREEEVEVVAWAP